MLHQRIVDGDHAPTAIAGLGVLLQPFETAIIERLFIPGCFGEPAIQTRLIRGDGKFAVDAADGFVFGDHQTGEIFGKMLASGVVVEQVTKDSEGLFDQGGKVHNRRHRGFLLGWRGFLQGWKLTHTIRQSAHFAKLQ